MLSPRNVIELLSPARNFDCARAAILHGADAVYIGAPMFGARKSASNTIDDIRRTVDFAHQYGCRVFVALNTVLFDHELAAAEDIAWQLYDAKADALIVQDMGLLETKMPPIELHASTQMDNRSVDKVQFLEQCGFKQVVLARELSIDEIRKISSQTSVRLECFIHGALCVSYSGQCYMSQSVNGRSANRGECAQPCRLKYNLYDANGNVVARQKHLLSLKDQNQSSNLEDMILAGASTLKIEGRLKDETYVSNVTLHYRRLIDSILERHPEYSRLSQGVSNAIFEPNVSKSFNRGFTTYFANERRSDIWQPDTPKSIGEKIGKVSEVRKDSFRIDTQCQISNGDGLCYRMSDGSYDGLRVNRAEANVVYPLRMPKGLVKGTVIFRNSDVAFDAKIAEQKTTRQIPVSLTVFEDKDGRICVSMFDEQTKSEIRRDIKSDIANNPELSKNNIIRQMSKMGATPFCVENVSVDDAVSKRFFAAADLNALRRDIIEKHIENKLVQNAPQEFVLGATSHKYIEDRLFKSANVVNAKAKEFFERHGSTLVELGYERQKNYEGCIVMTTKHCLMNSLGFCLKQHPEKRKLLPMILEGENGKYEVSTDCARCVMIVKKR